MISLHLHCRVLVRRMRYPTGPAARVSALAAARTMPAAARGRLIATPAALLPMPRGFVSTRHYGGCRWGRCKGHAPCIYLWDIPAR
jgi:hypothetical protein